MTQLDKQVAFIGTDDGKLTLWCRCDPLSEDTTGPFTKVADCSNSDEVADALKKFGTDSWIMFSSSFDFASEDGFEDDDGAQRMFMEGSMKADKGFFL